MSTDTTDRTASHLDHVLSDDKRYYQWGEGEQLERYLRVSTALGLVGEGDGLMRWATGLSAEAAVDILPKLIRATRLKDCERTHNRCRSGPNGHDYRVRCMSCPCDECTPCVRLWVANRHYAENARRSDEGTRVHDVAEHWVLNSGTVKDHNDDVSIYVKQWLAWVADYGLTPDSWEMSEATVVNRQYGYAGTLDGVLTIHADATPAAAELVAKVLNLPPSQVAGKSVRVIADLKSREKEEAKLFADMALQQAAYRNAETVRLRDGREFPLPASDGAIIVQVRPDGYLCRPVSTNDATFGAFLSALSYAKWHLEFATASVSSRTFKTPKEPAAPKPVKTVPAKKAAPRKASARKTVPPKVEEPEALIPAPPSRPIKAVAAAQSATLRSMTRQPAQTVHPDSPFGDAIPF